MGRADGEHWYALPELVQVAHEEFVLEMQFGILTAAKTLLDSMSTIDEVTSSIVASATIEVAG